MNAVNQDVRGFLAISDPSRTSLLEKANIAFRPISLRYGWDGIIFNYDQRDQVAQTLQIQIDNEYPLADSRLPIVRVCEFHCILGTGQKES